MVEEEETLEDTEPIFAAGIVRRFWFGRSSPIAKRRVVVEAPASLAMKYSVRSLTQLSVSREEQNATVRLTFEATSLPAITDFEPNLPSDMLRLPHVVVSTASSWQAIAAQYHAIIEKQIGAADLKAVPARHAGADRMATIRQLVAYLHSEVRYTGIEFGDASLVPRAPAEIFKRKYGDCKDKAAALVALLRAAGIPAHLALLSTGPGIDVDADHPGMGIFDHAIVYVPGTPEAWIDATAEFRAAGSLPYMDQGRMALVVSPESTTLRRTAEAKPEDNLLLEYRNFELPEFGPARVTEISEPHGTIDALYRAQYGGGDSKELRDGLDTYVKDEYLADGITTYERGSGTDLQTQFRLQLEAAKARRGSVDLETAGVVIRLDGLFLRFSEYVLVGGDQSEKEAADVDMTKSPRTADVVFEPFVTEWRYKVTAPAGFRVRSLLRSRSFDVGPARMTQTFEAQNEGTVTAVIRLDSVRGRYTAAEALAARKAVRELRTADALMVMFDHKGAAEPAAGNVREALASYRALASQHPREALHRVQLSGALLKVGLGEQARVEAREAIGLEPQSAMAHQSLGWVLQHDLIGRRFKKGFDFDGAAAAYRQARQLDPKDPGLLADFAILLEHDASGERYSSKAKLADAIALYREIARIDPEAGRLYSDNILFDLIYSGQFTEANTLLTELPQTPGRLALALVSIAGVDGPAAALQHSSELARVRSSRQPALKTAANILRNMRLYAAPADLLAAAVEGEPNAAQMLGQVQALRLMNQATGRVPCAMPAILLQGIAEGAMAQSGDGNASPVADSVRREQVARDGQPYRA